MGLVLTKNKVYFIFGLFAVFSISTAFLASDSIEALATGEWQTIVPGSVAITPLNAQITELSLQAAADIPHVERQILGGFAWLYEDGASAFVAVTHLGIRDSVQNPDHWHPHNITFEAVSGSGGSITHCINTIDTTTNAGIPINGDEIRVNARNSELLAPFLDPPTAVSFDIIPDVMLYVCDPIIVDGVEQNFGVGFGVQDIEPEPVEEESGGKGGGQGGNPNK